jgi:predicted MFS family arabinose efflux permease
LLLGFFGGGWMLQHYGWRSAFLASGTPGLLIVLLLIFTVREPERGLADRTVDAEAAPSLVTTAKHLASLPSFRWIAFGCSMSAFGGYAGIYFIPKFLIVSHHMTPIQVGIALSLLTGVFGAIGTYASGVWADRWGARNINGYMYVPIVTTAIAVPFAPLFYLPQDLTYLGPSYAMAQGMVPLRMRAQTVGIMLFILNMIALGLGPATVGLISDLLKPTFGADSLRYALLTNVVSATLGALCYWRATKTLKADLARGSSASGTA